MRKAPKITNDNKCWSQWSGGEEMSFGFQKMVVNGS